MIKKNNFFSKIFEIVIDKNSAILYYLITFNEMNAPLAQLVEQRTVNPSVASSILAGGAKRTLKRESFFYVQICI